MTENGKLKGIKKPIRDVWRVDPVTTEEYGSDSLNRREPAFLAVLGGFVEQALTTI